jgi:hypothetical protein
VRRRWGTQIQILATRANRLGNAIDPLISSL